MMNRGVVLSLGLLAGACTSEPVEIGRVTVRLGHGDGSFGAPNQYGVPVDPRAIALHDLDLDGHLDLAVVGYAQEYAELLRGRGDGTFEPLQRLNVTESSGLVVEDFNHDGWPDLAIAGDGFVEVCLARAPGRFGSCEKYTGGSWTAVVAADFGGDGHIDLAVVSYFGSVAMVLDGDGNGSFAEPHVIGEVDHPISLAIGHLDADGRPDIVTANLALATPSEDTGRTISVILSAEEGFQAPVHHDVAAGPMVVGVTDLDGGPEDVVVATILDGVRVLSGTGDGGFSSAAEWTTHPGYALALDDFNRDGHADVAVSSVARAQVDVLLGDGSGGFDWSGFPAPQPFALASGDLDGDGVPDLVLAEVYGSSTIF